MSNAAKNKLLTTPNLARIAVLAAVASVLFLIEIPLGMPFYKLDLSNIPVLIGAFSMGPVAGVLILVLKSLIGLTHSSSAGVGELADFIMGLAMILPAGLIYQRNKTRRTALLRWKWLRLSPLSQSCLISWYRHIR
jgi:riboflavin transporter FmnP